MDWLRSESTQARQRKCGMVSIAGEVEATVKNGRVGYRGTMRCGSRRCPDCGSKLARALRDDLEKAVTSWRESGGRVLFGTLTVRHHLEDSLDVVADAVSHCWGRATGGRGWVADRREYGVWHWFRIQEEKWSDENGWHVHVHFLLFVWDKGVAPVNPDTDGLLASMFGRWKAGAVSMGLGAPLIRAQDLHEVTGANLDDIAEYFAKQSTASGAADAGDMALELTSPSTKTGGGLAPSQLLAAAMTETDPKLLRRYRAVWFEYERGMKGRRVIAWSRGLREALELGQELTVEQIEQRDEALPEAEKAAVVLGMTGRAWKELTRRRGRRAELAAVILTEGQRAAFEWCRERLPFEGDEVWMGKRDRQQVSFVLTDEERAGYPMPAEFN
jgi:hypothetical protein